MNTHQISIWPLTDSGDFADLEPAFEGEAITETDAVKSFDAMTYENASDLDEWKGQPAYLVSLDRLDDDGIGICQQHRVVRPA